MDFMKVFDQTVREIKREVNLKVLKVPEMEQKVLDATDNEPWGPHGSALAEIAQATKKFSECQMVMNVLWTRLTETGKDWRYVYKALAVIEYLVSHGSELLNMLSQMGRIWGINVRKKAETIVALLNNKDKIQEVRNKAAANRDKYFGLSSTGITYKSGSATSASFSSSSYQSSERYGGLSGTGAGDRFKDSYRDRDRHEEDKIEKDSSSRSRRESSSKKASARYGSRKDQDNISSSVSKSSNKSNDSENYSSVHTQSANVPDDDDDDDDDFDPRGTSAAKAAVASSNQVDLFGQSLIDDFIDAPTSVPAEKPGINSGSSEHHPRQKTGAFADSTFVSAPPQTANGASSQTQNGVDLFASQPTISPLASSTVDLFSAPDPVMQPETKSTNAAPTNTNIVDPFATVPLHNFGESDIFGRSPLKPSQSSVNDGSDTNLGKKSSADLKGPPKKDFQVKSGIWADSLSRGLIDLNISAPKKVNLADVGIVGGLTDGSDEREKGPQLRITWVEQWVLGLVLENLGSHHRREWEAMISSRVSVVAAANNTNTKGAKTTT
ncbi:ENTH/VHS family protein [Prunus dulcis]|uniref:ENTH/VHS family protein n=1 Tax=Prunus dulcis TaxID=3755 RepID=A0A4Y1QTA6_PRUDU|nr:ENTH/VHS family protein [Prunus dulcis]